MTEHCPFPSKQRFRSREDAISGARNICMTLTQVGRTYQALYPYICPAEEGGPHWHLSSSRQATLLCVCGERRPAWFNKERGEWVIYAHDLCPTQAVAR